MKKILLSISLIMASVHFAKAQDVKEDTVTFRKMEEPAFTVSYNYPKPVVKKVLADKLATMGLNHKKNEKGFTVYKAAVWQQIADTKKDVYTKVSGSKHRTVVYILVSKGYDNFISSASDSGTAAKVKDFLSGLEKDIQDYQHELTVAEKQKDLEKQLEKENKLRKKLETQISETKKAQSALDAANPGTSKQSAGAD